MENQDNPLEFKTEDPEIRELQRQAEIFLELCNQVEKKIGKVGFNPETGKFENEK